ncbi:MAG: nucleotide exchange factor GrpE [Gammaproteobacteria bacterium]|nr:MAG: nucleotide exchange factor GrpE [Gammaproteobacteria bacterium]
MSDVNKTEADAPAEGDAFEEELQEVEAESAEAEQSAEELNRLLQAARAKADEHYDRLARAHAEMENLKRRHAQELEKAHKYALEKFVKELLGVWDSLELGHAAAQDENADVAKLREGTELTLKMLVDVMGKFGVEQIDPRDQPFDPEYHQAMATVPRDDVPPNTVVDVIQKGYALNGRLVRPALVAVSKAPEEG